MTSRLSVRELRARLHTTIIGHRILYYPSVPSTNDVALAQGSLGMPEGVLVLAEEQTAGRAYERIPTARCFMSIRMPWASLTSETERIRTIRSRQSQRRSPNANRTGAM